MVKGAVDLRLHGGLGGCKMCALRLARIVGQRHWWFFLVREPLVLGMRLLAWCNRIDRSQHVAPNPECSGCIRFMKNALEAESPTFRFLNGIIGERFSRLRNARLAAEEISEARRLAGRAMPADQERAHVQPASSDGA